jgi:integrase
MLSDADEYIEDRERGQLRIFKRNGIFQARIYRGKRSRGYIYKSLDTRDLEEARKAATKLFHHLEFRTEHGLPLVTYTMSQVINEYVAMREKDHEQAKRSGRTLARREGTSEAMLRQIKRVVKFWHQYCGKMPLEKVDDGVLRDFILWRKDFYHRMPADKLPKTARLNPTDKTLQWELTLGKTILKYAQGRKYRGAKPLPTYTYQADKKIVRPAFTAEEYKKLRSGISVWIKEAKNEKWRQTRLLLRDYVRILAGSGMRVGEANSLKWRDVVMFTDGNGNFNYMFKVRGKTGERTVIPSHSCYKYINELKERYPNAKSDDLVFRMPSGSPIKTLIDQFKVLLKRVGLFQNSAGEQYTLYSLRHFYAVNQLRQGIPVYDLAKNMGTSVAVIEQYYGKSATADTMATRLGGWVLNPQLRNQLEREWKESDAKK